VREGERATGAARVTTYEVIVQHLLGQLTAAGGTDLLLNAGERPRSGSNAA